jgi:hypothetical protein
MEQSKVAIAVQLSIKRFTLLNRYYSITRFYAFLKDTAIKGGIAVLLFVAVFVGLEFLCSISMPF